MIAESISHVNFSPVDYFVSMEKFMGRQISIGAVFWNHEYSSTTSISALIVIIFFIPHYMHKIFYSIEDYVLILFVDLTAIYFYVKSTLFTGNPFFKTVFLDWEK